MSRILTIPILVWYVIYNQNSIAKLSTFKYIMAYAGSGTLILLNIIWSIMLTIKLIGMTKKYHKKSKTKYDL